MRNKTIVIYYTWSGNTETVAKLIQQQTNGDLFQIKPVNPYPTDYNKCVDQSKGEIQSGYMPELVSLPDESIKQYDTVFIGTPVWWCTMAPPVLTLLSNVDLTGKIIIPFSTHGGDGELNSLKDIVKNCPNSISRNGISLFDNGGVSAATIISEWLKKILN